MFRVRGRVAGAGGCCPATSTAFKRFLPEPRVQARSPRTDAAGRFEIRYVEAGPYEIFVEADGYENASLRCQASRENGCEGLAFTLRTEG